MYIRSLTRLSELCKNVVMLLLYLPEMYISRRYFHGQRARNGVPINMRLFNYVTIYPLLIYFVTCHNFVNKSLLVSEL